MPPTTTSNLRTKRIDTRPNAKQRRNIEKKAMSKSKVQDFRVTRIKKSEQKERVIESKNLPPMRSILTDREKAIRAIKKKLKAIEQLMELQKTGATLDDQQLEKIERLEELMNEMQNLLTGNDEES